MVLYCCHSPTTLLLSSVIQVEEVCDRSRVVPQVLKCKLRRMALIVEQMFYGVWCHSTLQTNIWYAAGDAGIVTVRKPTVTRTQLGESGTGWPSQLDNAQTAVFTSAKSVQYVQILLLGHKETPGIPIVQLSKGGRTAIVRKTIDSHTSPS